MSARHPLSCGLQYLPLSTRWLPALLAIEQEAYADPWSENMFLQEIENGASHFLLAFREEQLVGYAGFWMVLDEAHLTKVTIARDYRGLGLGVTLLTAAMDFAKDLGAVWVRLEVRESNAPARRLYAKFGFSEVRVRRGYYARTHEDAIEMAMRLETPPSAACGQG